MTRGRQDIEIDWHSVMLAVDGQLRDARLARPECRMVARRLRYRVNIGGTVFGHLWPGQLTFEQVGKRIGMTGNGVQKLYERLASAVQQRCPVCECQMWVLDTGVVEAHPDRLFLECPLTGCDLAAADIAAVTVDWLQQWWEAGDRDGVQAHLRGLDSFRMAEIMLAAATAELAGSEFPWLAGAVA